jgi:hypothetical protein
VDATTGPAVLGDRLEDSDTCTGLPPVLPLDHCDSVPPCAGGNLCGNAHKCADSGIGN